MKIWKYEIRLIPHTESFTLQIPGDPDFLHVGVQLTRRPLPRRNDLSDGLPPRDQEIPVLWVLIREPDAEPIAHQFRVVATGEDFDLPIKACYLGTFQIDWFVGHLFHLPS